jgi:DNA-binding transcriptional LysR family regulator
MDRIDEWRVFVAVAAARSFVSAARSLGRSPQAATRAVAALEQRLGTRLLARTTRSVSLTNEGERYLARGRHALAEIDLLETREDAQAPLHGVLTVTAPVMFGQLHVVPVVIELLAAHDGLDVRLVLLDRIVSLAEEGIDVGVRIGALPDSSLRARVVGHVRSVVCASPAYLERAGRPRSPESLREHACIAFNATTPIADRWTFGKKARGEKRPKSWTVTVRPRLTVNTAPAAIEAALTGLGLVRVLSYQADAFVSAGKLAVVLRSFEPEPVPVQLVHLPGAPGRAATAFLDLATERLQARLARPSTR